LTFALCSLYFPSVDRSRSISWEGQAMTTTDRAMVQFVVVRDTATALAIAALVFAAILL